MREGVSMKEVAHTKEVVGVTGTCTEIDIKFDHSELYRFCKNYMS